LQRIEAAVAVERPREAARPLPDTPDQTVERDWRQAMPRAEPALSLAPLLLPTVAGAATLRGRQSPHP